jgi:hypothetical protein
VRGLAPRFALAMVEGMRVVGPVVGWVAALFTLHAQRRRLRVLENRLEARLQAVSEYVSRSNAQVGIRIEALRSVMEARD